jgi:Phage major capsid protein E.
MANPTTFDIQPRLTQIAMAARPEGMIADLVCPRIPAPGSLFLYTVSDNMDYFEIVDSRVGRKSNPNEVEFGAKDLPASVDDFALDSYVPRSDVEKAAAAGSNYDPQAAAAEGTSILLDLGREKRVADLYQDLNTYTPALRTTLSGTDQWQDKASTPYEQITEAFDDMLVRPNIGVMGRKAWRILRSHPNLVARSLNSSGVSGGEKAAGTLTRKQVADLLELDDILVGESFANLAKKGQNTNMQRLWGNHASFLRIDKNVRSVQGFTQPTFAFTAQWQTRFSGTIPDAKRGIRGGLTVRVGEQVKELVSFREVGYHFHNVVA